MVGEYETAVGVVIAVDITRGAFLRVGEGERPETPERRFDDPSSLVK